LDPCTDEGHQVIDNAFRRVTSKARTKDDYICDIDLNRGWYRFKIFGKPAVIPTECQETEHCTTQAPIWLNLEGTELPVVGETKRVTACAALQRNSHPKTPTTCCILKLGIRVKNCGDYLVYFLRPPQVCHMAYCAEESRVPCGPEEYSVDGFQPCRDAYPSPVYDVVLYPNVVDHKPYLECAFLPPTSNSTLELGYTVTWYKHEDRHDKTELFSVDTTKTVARMEIKDKIVMGKWVSCQVQSYYKESKHLKDRGVKSRPFFVGIKVVPSTLNLAEGGPFHIVTLKTTIPIICQNSTQDFCTVNVNLKTIDADGIHRGDDIVLSKCLITFIPKPCNAGQCGIETILVTAVTDFTNDGDRKITIVTDEIEDDNKLWDGYDPSDIAVTVKDIPTAQCYSFTDPHFITFDGRKYDYYKTGTFLLYKSTIRDFEVHNKLWPCGGTSYPVSCNCGFAVRENNNVISVDMCNGNFLETSPEVKVLGMFPLVEGVKINENREGDKITIEFPSGTFVRADIADWGMSITIQAPSVDFNRTIGLCGSFDGDPDNDFLDRDGNILTIPLKQGQANEFAEQWRLPDGGLFSNDPVVKVYRPTVPLCNCGASSKVKQKTTLRTLDRFNLHQQCNKFSNIRRPKVLPSRDMTSLYANNIFGGRKRRNVRDIRFRERAKYFKNIQPVVETRERFELLPAPVFSIDSGNYVDRTDYVYHYPHPVVDFSPLVRKWPTPSGITEKQAREICEGKLLNTTSALVCRSLLGAKLDDAIEMCVTDLQLTDDFFWLEPSEALIENQCEAAIVQDASLWEQDDEGRTKAKNIVDSLICPNDCSSNGICTPTGCFCSSGFKLPDCKLKFKSQAPKIVNLENNGVCDTRFQNCSKIRVSGRRFKDRDNFMCIITPLSLSNELTETTAPPTLKSAVFINKRTVLCELPAIPSSLSGEDRNPEDGLFKWQIQVSFDGFEPSNTVVLTVFDSLCQKCDWTGLCEFKENTCFIKGKCFASGERDLMNPLCRECNPGINRLAWSINKDNLPPLYESLGPSQLMTTFVGTEISHQFAALDPEGSYLTFSLVDSNPGMAMTSSGLLIWTPETTGEKNIVVEVTDECGSSVEMSLLVTVEVCDCENGGTCAILDELSEIGSGDSYCACPQDYIGNKCEIFMNSCASDPYPCIHGDCRNLFDTFECECPSTHTGQFCETPLLATCDPNPCYSGVECSINEGVVSCDSCPQGMMGDGIVCTEMCHRPCPRHSYCAEPDVCKCSPGYVGFGCHIALCRPDCQNGGRCIEPNICRCADGYSGEHCETALCDPPCQNSGECYARNTCACKYGYLGPRCETMTCNKYCENGGVCSSPDVCRCQPGWSGPTCSTAICAPYCQNGGLCIRPNECMCFHGFFGQRCEKGICSPPCQNGGTCSRLNMCTCPDGYYGRHCERVRCEPMCQNGGRCVQPNLCSCPSGYRGSKCHRAICVSGCRNGGVCIQPNVCECPEGYGGFNCQTPICKQRCMYGGRCIRPNTCLCRQGHSGPICDKRSAYIR
ncbi:von Willebrand factor D and EGF domain-containing protein-like, partial [Glandiceps talaboti]